MANNLLYVSDGDYGKRTGYLAALVQGQSGQVIPLEIRDLANNVVNLTGYTTITGRMDDRRGNVTSIDGTLALDATPSTAPQVNWTVSATDTGTPGVFDVILVISNGSATLKTLPVSLAIHADPAATVVPGTAMVAVTQAQATLLAAIAGLTGLVKMAGGAASAILIKLDGTSAPTVNDDSGDGYGIGSIWVDTTNDNAYIATDVTVGAANWLKLNSAGDLTTHAALTVTAHGGLVPQDASILSKSGAYPLAAGDEAKIIECNGTFTITLPNGLDTGFQAVIVNIGTGVITLAATTTLTTKDSAVTLASQYGAATVYHAGSNVWRAFGDLS